jgi:acyl-CoA synthetase (AMP-forming)/AMP-acid ligase II
MFLARSGDPSEYLVFNGDRSSFDSFLKRAFGISEMLRDIGSVPGDRVVIDLGNTPGTLVSIAGAVIGGQTFIPMDPQASRDKLAYVLGDSGARAIITCREDVPGNVFKIGPDEVARAARDAPLDLSLIHI